MASIHNITQLIQNASSGLSLNAILLQYPEFNRRTLQRWLKKLVAEKKIATKGEGRARVYVKIKPSLSNLAEDDFPTYIPLSADSQDILNYVNQTVNVRKPVGYQAEFLDEYQPNKTWYLSPSLRTHLKKMGDTRQDDLPAGTYGRDILGRLMIDLSWASSNLEGNTYSRLDTVELIENGKAANGKAAIETQMILNHKAAIEFLVENADSVDFNRYTFLNLHSILAENLLANPADEGRVRQHAVEIGKSVFHPLSVPGLINEKLDLILSKTQAIKDPFEQAFFIMVHLPYLQPFSDINKRTSRLGANLSFIRGNLCPLTFLDVPEKAYSRAILGVYELTRIELLRDVFVWAYERSTQEYLAIKQELAEPDPLRLTYRAFIKKTIHQVVSQIDQEPLAIIKNSVMNIDAPQRENLQALIIDELRRLHEGTLARYGLRPSEYLRWKAEQKGA